MKKFLIVLVLVAFAAIALSSCSSSVNCPAYGEVQRYQSEQRY